MLVVVLASFTRNLYCLLFYFLSNHCETDPRCAYNCFSRYVFRIDSNTSPIVSPSTEYEKAEEAVTDLTGQALWVYDLVVN